MKKHKITKNEILYEKRNWEEQPNIVADLESDLCISNDKHVSLQRIFGKEGNSSAN